MIRVRVGLWGLLLGLLLPLLFGPLQVQAQEQEAAAIFRYAEVIEVKELTSNPAGAPKGWHVRYSFELDDETPQKGGFDLFATTKEPLTMPTELSEGDTIILSCNSGGCDYFDRGRSGGLWFMGLIFIAVIWWVCRDHGLFALFALGFSAAFIFAVMTPLLMQGFSPLWLSLLTALLLAVVLITMSHGFSSRSLVAIKSTAISLILALLFAQLACWVLGLNGGGGSIAMYSGHGLLKGLDLHGLFLGAILLGSLGVLGDITWTQSAMVEELATAHPRMRSVELVKAVMPVGRDHAAGMLHSLVMAYIGAGLPMFILVFYDSQTPLWVTLNSELVLEELVRMIAGGFALTLAVPISSWVAALRYGERPRLSRTSPLVRSGKRG
uniref:YibE/F family protein n=1 Tax=Magnetococcus massalia (strain MO-1) TaxID=451514 RepID=A0A1S7LIV6_MAGMO|nr:conserved protein of unknown function [Include YibE/F like domain] [Candidatus Magnetococcus massalia]